MDTAYIDRENNTVHYTPCEGCEEVEITETQRQELENMPSEGIVENVKEFIKRIFDNK